MSFPTDDAVKKSVYLSIKEIEKRWDMPIKNWALVVNQFIAIVENRIDMLYITITVKLLLPITQNIG